MRTWSTLRVRSRTLAPPRLSTASTVERWSAYMTNANPLGFCVLASRGRETSTTSPYLQRRESGSATGGGAGRLGWEGEGRVVTDWEQMVMTSPSVSW